MEALIGGIVGFLSMLLIAYFVTRPSKRDCNYDFGLIPDTDVIRWINATHAVLSTVNQKSTQVYGGVLKREYRIEDEKQALADGWDIYDRASLLSSIKWLIQKGGHRMSYHLPPHEIAAWDYSRALSLLSSGYLIGYLSREEALDRSLPLAQKCQQEYESWDDFMEAYFKGYRAWSGQSSKDRERIYRQLKKRENSVYSLPWDLDLRKEW